MSLIVHIKKKLRFFSLQADFEAEDGVLALLGPSGCGKSMTLKCIAGIEKPDCGRIVLDGRVLFDSDKKINLPPRQRRVGYLFQNYALFPDMTARQNILCGLHAEKDRQKREQRADAMMELLQIRDVANLRPGQLSGGQAQRVALGRILVNEPELLMLDEPFAALDTHLRLKLQVELKNLLSGYDRGIIMVTHDRDEAFRMCDRIGVIDEGQMLAMKETRELFADPGSRAVASITGCKNIAYARKTGKHEVFVPEWNIYLKTGKDVRDDLKAIGIRAHSFRPGEEENRFPITIVREMEEPFEWVSEFAYEGQASRSPAVWWRYSKAFRLPEPPDALGVVPDEVLLLY